MILRKLKPKNWRNFRSAELDLVRTNYVLGPNASGKSNLLDSLRFARDVGKPKGGGLQQAVEPRGGISKVRCLHHRNDNEIAIELGFSDSLEDEAISWSYRLAFKSESRGKRRPIVTEEKVTAGAKVLLERPDRNDREDALLLTETYLEQSLANRKFRPVVEFVNGIRYLHLVPQLLKYSDQIGGALIETDPFGQSFLESIAAASEGPRTTRLGRINKALSAAVPQLRELRFVRDERSGRPHLEEEPELSLDERVVARLPPLFDRLLRQTEKAARKRRTSRRQVFISTRSQALPSNEGIDRRGVSIIEMTAEGSVVRPPNADEDAQLDAGFPIAEAVLPGVHPGRADQLSLPFRASARCRASTCTPRMRCAASSGRRSCDIRVRERRSCLA